MAQRVWDWIVCLWYRVTYCPRHGHLFKMDMPGQCFNCGAGRKIKIN